MSYINIVLAGGKEKLVFKDEEGSLVAQSVTTEMENIYLNFIVGNEVYGIEIRYVLQIIGMQEINELPDMPRFMKGFISLRGSVIPVVSMRLQFGKEEESYTDRTCIIVIQVGERDVGLIVDAIQETILIEPEDISPSPTLGKGRAVPYIMGIARLHGKQNVVLINIHSLIENFD